MTTIEQLNRDFDGFYEFCKENHLTDAEIRQICQPLLQTIRQKSLVKRFKIAIIITILFAALYVVSNTEAISWHLSAIGRILLIKTLPFYDWTQLRNEYCLLKHPTVTENNNNHQPNCILCESVQEIPKLETPTHAIYEHHIKLHVPVAIATQTDLLWPIQSLAVSNLTALLTTNRILTSSYPCKIATNLLKHTTVDTQLDELLMRALDAPPRYFIHFQICEWDAVKEFRLFAPRPTFLPRQLAPIQYSWLLINRNYNIAKFKRIDLSDNVAIVVQTRGSTNYRLVPQRGCESECFEVDVVMDEGEMLFVTSLWNLEYRPMLGENVAVVLETH